jgi:hypothetical protein
MIIRESIKDILIPKSDEEILSNFSSKFRDIYIQASKKYNFRKQRIGVGIYADIHAFKDLYSFSIIKNKYFFIVHGYMHSERVDMSIYKEWNFIAQQEIQNFNELEEIIDYYINSTVNEDISNIFKPKTKEEIFSNFSSTFRDIFEKSLEKYKHNLHIFNHEFPFPYLYLDISDFGDATDYIFVTDYLFCIIINELEFDVHERFYKNKEKNEIIINVFKNGGGINSEKIESFEDLERIVNYYVKKTTIQESLTDIFKPKSEEEILSVLPPKFVNIYKEALKKYKLFKAETGPHPYIWYTFHLAFVIKLNDFEFDIRCGFRGVTNVHVFLHSQYLGKFELENFEDLEKVINRYVPETIKESVKNVFKSKSQKEVEESFPKEFIDLYNKTKEKYTLQSAANKVRGYKWNDITVYPNSIKFELKPLVSSNNYLYEFSVVWFNDEELLRLNIWRPRLGYVGDHQYYIESFEDLEKWIHYYCGDNPRELQPGERVFESVSDIFKSKSEKEIIKELKEYDTYDLIELWRISGNILAIKEALKRKNFQNVVWNEDLVNIIDRHPELNNEMVQIIINIFSELVLEKKTNGYFIKVKEWGEFSVLFQENKEISEKDIEKILSANSMDIFEYYDMDVHLSDYDWVMEKFANKVHTGLLKKLTLKFAKEEDGLDISEIKKAKKLKDIFTFIVKNKEELPEIRTALEWAIIRTHEAADEYTAYNELKNAIKKKFGWNEPTIEEDYLVFPVDADDIIYIFKVCNNLEDGIKYYPPYYGWQGDIEKHPDVFNDSLQYELENIKEEINESSSVSNILKPKSKDEIIKYFNNLSISNKVIMWSKYNLNDLKEYFPLILQIYVKFKEDLLENRFNLSTFKVIHTAQSEIGGVGFGIFDYKTSKLQWISLEQFNDEEYVHIFIGDDYAYEDIIEDYQGFLKWFKDEYLSHFPINEGIKDVLKPKSREEIVKALEDVDFDRYVVFVDNEIDKQRVPHGNADDLFIKFREFVIKGWEEKTPPTEVAHNIIETYYRDEWKPDGVMTLSNTGGMELKFVDNGEGVEYRYSGDIIPKGADVEYEYEKTEPDEDYPYSYDGTEIRTYFEDDRGEKWYLDQFMRVRW